MARLADTPTCGECGKKEYQSSGHAKLVAIFVADKLGYRMFPYFHHGKWHLRSEKPNAGPSKTGWYEYGNHRQQRRAENKRWRKTEAGKACQKRYLARKKRKKHLTRVAWALTALIDKRMAESREDVSG